MDFIKFKLNIIIGSVILILNSLWAYRFIWLFYAYKYSGILWFYMYPSWVLIFNIVVGIIGIISGILLIINKTNIKRAVLIDLPILIIGFLISYLVPMI